MLTPIPPHPAALVKTRKELILVITDLHIGWEMALSKKGIYVTSQTPKLLKKLTDLITIHKPRKLLVLGDVKHTIATAEKTEWQDIPDFFNEVVRRIEETCIVRGNHDGNLEPLLPDRVRMLPATGIAIGDIGFFHGHQWPSPSLLRCRTLVMGHVHPTVGFRDPAGFRITKQVWVKANCDGTQLARVLSQKRKMKFTERSEESPRRHHGIMPETKQLLIMPSFNDFLGGRPINERRRVANGKAEMITGPVLRSEAVDMKNAEAHLLDGTFLGTIDQLTTLN